MDTKIGYKYQILTCEILIFLDLIFKNLIKLKREKNSLGIKKNLRNKKIRELLFQKIMPRVNHSKLTMPYLSRYEKPSTLL